jgi:uncharacterized protein (DUF433 family)
MQDEETNHQLLESTQSTQSTPVRSSPSAILNSPFSRFHIIWCSGMFSFESGGTPARRGKPLAKGFKSALEWRSFLVHSLGMSSLLARITISPDICHGKPVIRNLRYPVESMLEYLAGGDTIEDLLAEFPDLEREDLLACLEFAAESLKLKTQHLALA